MSKIAIPVNFYFENNTNFRDHFINDLGDYLSTE